MRLDKARNVKIGEQQINKIYLGKNKVWDYLDARVSCYSLGIWIMKEPWLMYKKWKMNKQVI